MGLHGCLSCFSKMLRETQQQCQYTNSYFSPTLVYRWCGLSKTFKYTCGLHCQVEVSHIKLALQNLDMLHYYKMAASLTMVIGCIGYVMFLSQIFSHPWKNWLHSKILHPGRNHLKIIRLSQQISWSSNVNFPKWTALCSGLMTSFFKTSDIIAIRNPAEKTHCKSSVIRLRCCWSRKERSPIAQRS